MTMSTNAFKVVLRARLPDVKSDEEHLAWCRANIGEPGYVEEYEGRVNFSYSVDEKYRLIERGRPHLNPCGWRDEFGVEMVLAEGLDNPETFKMTVAELVELEDRFSKLPGVSGEILFLSYGWYTGTDEPIEWE